MITDYITKFTIKMLLLLKPKYIYNVSFLYWKNEAIFTKFLLKYLKF